MQRWLLVSLLLLSVLFPASVPVARAQSISSDPTAGLATVRDRFVRSVLPTGGDARAQIAAEATQDATSLQSDGSWSDTAYDARAPHGGTPCTSTASW